MRGIIGSTNEVGLAQWALGERGAARASFRQAITLADTCTDRDFSALARQNLAAVLLEAVEISQATRTAAFELLDKASARHAAVGALAAQGRGAALHAAALRRDGGPGNLTMAVAVAREAVTAVEASGRIESAPGAYAELARCLQTAGRPEEAGAWAKSAIALFTAVGEHVRAEALTAEFTQSETADPADAPEHEDAR